MILAIWAEKQTYHFCTIFDNHIRELRLKELQIPHRGKAQRPLIKSVEPAQILAPGRIGFGVMGLHCAGEMLPEEGLQRRIGIDNCRDLRQKFLGDRSGYFCDFRIFVIPTEPLESEETQKK